MDDHELIQAHLKGDLKAFEALVKKHQNSVARLCYSILRSQNGVSDVVQDVFLSVFRGLARFRGDASFKTWLYKITVHETLHYIKKKKRWDTLVDRDYDPVETTESSNIEIQKSPEHLIFSGQKKEFVQKAIDQLSENHRIVLNLHYQEDLSVQEISTVIDIPVGSVKSRLYYARLKLKELLSPFYSKSQEKGEDDVF